MTNLNSPRSPVQINIKNEKEKIEKKRNGILFPLTHSSTCNIEISGEESKNVREFRIKATIPRQLQHTNNGANRTYENITEITTIKMDTSVEEYMDIRLKECSNKNTEMNCFYQNTITGSRSLLPLLIMHFEGLLGTCSYYPVKDVAPPTKAHNNVKEYNFNTLLRSGMKKEMKSLAKNFIVVIIFPSSAERYMNLVKTMLKNNYYIDGAYFINKNTLEAKSNRYVMNYNLIIEDFKLKYIHQTIIFKPINLSEKQLGEHYREFDNNHNRFYL